MGNTFNTNVRLFPVTPNFGMWSGLREIAEGTTAGFDLRQILVPKRYRQHVFFVTLAVTRDSRDTQSDMQWICDRGRDNLQWNITVRAHAVTSGDQGNALFKPYYWELPSDAADDLTVLIGAQWVGKVEDRGLQAQGVYVDYNAKGGAERLAQTLSRWAGGGGSAL